MHRTQPSATIEDGAMDANSSQCSARRRLRARRTIGWAQGRNVGFDWPATGADAQRTGWLRLDPNISATNLSKPGFEFLWREKLENAPRQSASLNQGVTMNGLIGFTPASFVTGVVEQRVRVDNDTGYPYGIGGSTIRFRRQPPQCPGGVTGAAGRVVSLVRAPLQLPVPATPGRGYRGGIGSAGEGVPMEIARRDGGAALRGASPIPGRAWRRRRCVRRPIRGTDLRRVEQRNVARARPGLGNGLERPAPFLPPNARFSDLTAIDGMLYTSTSRECGGVANGVWAIALDPENKTVARGRRTAAAPLATSHSRQAAGCSWPSVPGTPSAGGYANAIVALDTKTLQPVDWFTSSCRVCHDADVVDRGRKREIVAAATRDGRIFLLDAASLGGADHSTPALRSTPLAATSHPMRWRHSNSRRHAVAARTVGARDRRVQDRARGRQDRAAARLDVTRSCCAHRADHRQRRGLCGVERAASGSGGAVCVRLAVGS